MHITISLLMLLISTNLIAQPFNLFDFSLITKNDLHVNHSDTQGRALVGGNARIHHYTFSDKLNRRNLKNNPWGLIINGDLTYTSDLESSNMRAVFEGKTAVGGTVSNSNVTFSSEIYNISPNSIINVPELFKAVYKLSEILKTRINSNHVYSCYMGRCAISLMGYNKVNYYEIDGKTLSQSSTFTIESNDNSTNIINVSGKYIHLANFAFYPQKRNSRAKFDNRKVLWNFYEAENIQIDHIAWEGTILAPYADINYISGVLYGNIIANNLSSSSSRISGQINFETFIGSFK